VRERLAGTVAEFDTHAGLGTVTAGDGRSFWFHCTAIADGSRTIDAGTEVRFDVVPGHLGRWEAAAVEPV
jgi:cold shock CspA family protein